MSPGVALASSYGSDAGVYLSLLFIPVHALHLFFSVLLVFFIVNLAKNRVASELLTSHWFFLNQHATFPYKDSVLSESLR